MTDELTNARLLVCKLLTILVRALNYPLSTIHYPLSTTSTIHDKARNAMTALSPPNANEFERAYSTFDSRASFGM